MPMMQFVYRKFGGMQYKETNTATDTADKREEERDMQSTEKKKKDMMVYITISPIWSSHAKGGVVVGIYR